jgi:hypothetical protein
MFWDSNKKNKSDDDQLDTSLRVYTIPMEFYGGSNPVIKFKNFEKPVVQNQDRKSLVNKSAADKIAGNKSAPGFFGNKKLLAATSVIIFLFFAGASALYYFNIFKKSSVVQPVKTVPKNQNQVTPVQNIVTSTPPTTTQVVVATSTESTSTVAVATSTSSLSGGRIEFPSLLLGSSSDLDRDGLTDIEEELFNTDSGKPDTDSDGYEDGLEIFNLYSPNVIAPTRLIATGAVKEFLNPTFNYRIYYPANWAVGNVDPEYRDMLFSTITGENIEVRVFDKKSNDESFESWFAEWAQSEQFGAIKDFNTVFKGKGRSRSDKLVYYFEDSRYFYVIVYRVTASSVVNYKEVIEMMARSFRTSAEADAVLPEQKVIRELPTLQVESENQ